MNVQTDDQDLEAIAPKADPATLALRVRAPRTIRFRRTLIIGLTTASVTALLGLTAWALHPSLARLTRNVGGTAQTTAVKPTELLTQAPSTYSDLRKADLTAGGGDKSSYPSLSPADEAGARGSGGEHGGPEEKQRKAAERTAALASPVLTQIAHPEVPVDTPDAASNMRFANEDGSKLAAAPFGALTDQDEGVRRTALASATAAASSPVSTMLKGPESPFIVSAATIIPASLITGLNSDLPGFVSAQVTENVYDSVTGTILLIPQGAKLIGKSDSGISYGQRRALIVWQRLILPDGYSIELGNLPTTDEAGYSGLTDSVDTHGWALLKGVALSTLLGIGSELSFGSSDSDLVRAVRQSTESGANHAGEQLTSKTLDVQPTIHVRPGWPIRVIVHEDLLLRPWRAS